MRIFRALPSRIGARGVGRRAFVGFILGGAALVVGSTPSLAQGAPKTPVNVVATVSMLADAVRAIAGDRVSVSSLLGEGVDPHTYRPTRSDIARLSKADLILANGLNLEAQLLQPLKALSKSRSVVLAAERIPKQRLLVDQDYANQFDPHVWMDPSLWRTVVEAVRDALITLDPAGRAVYEAGTANYIAQLELIDRYSRKVLGSVQEDSRVLVTAHDAFRYFGRAYGFQVEGIQGISTESEAGLKRIEELVALVVSRRIRAAFFESSVPDRNIRALVEGARARGHRLAIGGELYSDSLGAPGSYEGSLIGMLDHNVTTIARALGGAAPSRGMAGKLRNGG